MSCYTMRQRFATSTFFFVHAWSVDVSVASLSGYLPCARLSLPHRDVLTRTIDELILIAQATKAESEWAAKLDAAVWYIIPLYRCLHLRPARPFEAYFNWSPLLYTTE